jgi:hypothetical protein
MPKFMTYQRPVPVNKQSWAGRPGHTNGPIRKAENTTRKDRSALPKLPSLPTSR